MCLPGCFSESPFLLTFSNLHYLLLRFEVATDNPIKGLEFTNIIINLASQSSARSFPSKLRSVTTILTINLDNILATSPFDANPHMSCYQHSLNEPQPRLLIRDPRFPLLSTALSSREAFPELEEVNVLVYVKDLDEGRRRHREVVEALERECLAGLGND
jgi:hypothetical protein